MFPNYRTTAADRRDKLLPGCIFAGILLVAAALLAWGYVLFHFVAKYW